MSGLQFTLGKKKSKEKPFAGKKDYNFYILNLNLTKFKLCKPGMLVAPALLLCKRWHPLISGSNSKKPNNFLGVWLLQSLLDINGCQCLHNKYKIVLDPPAYRAYTVNTLVN